MPSGYLASLREEDRARRYHFGDGGGSRTLVAESNAGGVEGRITGFITFGVCSEDPVIGEVYALNVDPGHWGNGVGSYLLGAAMTELAGAGHARAVLWVVAGNRRARRFYEHHGWSADGCEREDQLDRFPGPQGWGTVTEVRYAVDL
jgi:GNAT superfamily N-acetyltransferase